MSLRRLLPPEHDTKINNIAIEKNKRTRIQKGDIALDTPHRGDLLPPKPCLANLKGTQRKIGLNFLLDPSHLSPERYRIKTNTPLKKTRNIM